MEDTLTWSCAGCGLVAFDRERRCDCATNCVIPSDPQKAGCRSAWKTDPATNFEACLERVAELEAAARLGLEMAKANGLWRTAEKIEEALTTRTGGDND